MSFLSIIAPGGTFSDLLKDIRKQIEVERLETRGAHPLLVKNPTWELNRLVDSLEAELKVRMRLFWGVCGSFDTRHVCDMQYVR